MSKADQDVIREREEYVALSNRLIRQGHYDLTAQQMKIIFYIISKIRPTDDVYTWYSIEIRDLCRCCGIRITDSGVYYKRLKTDLKKLTWRSWFSLPDSEWENSISWLGDVAISKGSGLIKVIFNPFMGTFLFQLKENYTQYELQKILTFSSKYTIRVYVLLKSFIYQDKLDRNIPHSILLDLDRLRFSLVARGYEDWRDFYKRILGVALAEINEKSDEFHVEIETIRDRSNKIEKVRFILTAATAEQTDRAKAIRKEKLDA